MPRIFDNIDQRLFPALRETLELSSRSDFCVGDFNLRRWKQIDSLIEPWPGGEGHDCRLLVEMTNLHQKELLSALSIASRDGEVEDQPILRPLRRLAEEFRE